MVPAPEGPEGHGPSEAGGARAGRTPAQPGLRGHLGRGTPGGRVERGRSGTVGAATPVGSASPAADLGRKREPSAKGRTGTPTSPGPGDPESGRRRGEPGSSRGPPARSSRADLLPHPPAGPAQPHLSSNPGRCPPSGREPLDPGPPPPDPGRAPGSPAAPAKDRCAPGCR